MGQKVKFLYLVPFKGCGSVRHLFLWDRDSRSFSALINKLFEMFEDPDCEFNKDQLNAAFNAAVRLEQEDKQWVS